MEVHDATLTELDPVTLYGILALRSAVFVVEQNCVYLDPDGRDLEPDTRHLWIERDGAVAAALRMLHEPDDSIRIGRVVTAAAARRTGCAEALMRRALALVPDRAVWLGAQTYLADWYTRFGFVAVGEPFDEDGIPHLPMRLRREPSK